MTSQPTDNIQVLLHGRANYHCAKFTIEEVGNALLENRERFDALFHEIQTVTVLFGDHCSIMPIQCRAAIDSLEKAQQHAQHLQSLLDEPVNLPLIFTALRYRLIFQIHLIDKQARQIICFIESYRAICSGSMSSFASRQRRQQIYRSLATLSEVISDISQQTRFIKHEAHFHQAKLNAYNISTSMNDCSEEHVSNKNA